ncbi:5482_t:CDS:2, partial [Acaulospora morrowiae]
MLADRKRPNSTGLTCHILYLNGLAYDVLQKKYGDFYEVYLGPKRMIWLCREELVHEIMAQKTNSNFHYSVTADSGLDEIGVLNSGVVYNLDYKAWEYYRRFYTRSILKPSFMIQSLNSVREVFNEMEGYWEQLGEDTVLDFPHWTKRFFMDSTLLLTANKRAYSLANYYNSISIGKKVK